MSSSANIRSCTLVRVSSLRSRASGNPVSVRAAVTSGSACDCSASAMATSARARSRGVHSSHAGAAATAASRARSRSRSVVSAICGIAVMNVAFLFEGCGADARREAVVWGGYTATGSR